MQKTRQVKVEAEKHRKGPVKYESLIITSVCGLSTLFEYVVNKKEIKWHRMSGCDRIPNIVSHHDEIRMYINRRILNAIISCITVGQRVSQEQNNVALPGLPTRSL